MRSMIAESKVLRTAAVLHRTETCLPLPGRRLERDVTQWRSPKPGLWLWNCKAVSKAAIAAKRTGKAKRFAVGEGMQRLAGSSARRAFSARQT